MFISRSEFEKLKRDIVNVETANMKILGIMTKLAESNVNIAQQVSDHLQWHSNLVNSNTKKEGM